MPKKILLADDSITIQKVVELTFSDGDYEVTAVNNGAKAIAKLGEMRPDIILSDIIMPEKNGYEVCEFVKSHPEFRNIPVVLLTGTFEPFDPDRAEKAGCDAVVTKPFESQSLIHRVEELISAAQAAAPAPAAAPEPPAAEPSPWMDETVPTSTTESPFGGFPPQSGGFSTQSGGFAPQDAGFAPAPAAEPFAHNADIFSAAPTPDRTTEMPFDSQPAFGGSDEAAFGGETRAFPKMSFDDFQQASQPSTPAMPEWATPEPPPAPEPSPWDEQPAFGGETRAFQKLSFEEMQQSQPEPEPLSSGDAFSTPDTDYPAATPYSAPAAEPSPWDDQGSNFGDETRAFQKPSFEDLAAPAPAPESFAPPVAEPSPWDEQQELAGETRAFQKLSFDDVPQASSPEPLHVTPAPSPWDEPATEPEPSAFAGGETQAFPRMSFEELQQASSAQPDYTSSGSGFGTSSADFGASTPDFNASADFDAADNGQQTADNAPSPENPWDAPAPAAASAWDEPSASTPAWAMPEEPATTSSWNDEPAPQPDAPAWGEPESPQPEPQETAAWDEPAPAAPWGEPEPEPLTSAPSWSPTADTSSIEVPSSNESFTTVPASPFSDSLHAEETPFSMPSAEAEPPSSSFDAAEEAPLGQPSEPVWSPAAVSAPEPEPNVPSYEPEPEAEEPAAAAAASFYTPAASAPASSEVSSSPGELSSSPGELSEEQIERIALRVVQLLSDKAVRDIAWEVIPDLAEMVVKERIRELETEA
ncbi:MAG TPA: response regulator [Thermoanaerobaculia bacterium]